MMDAHGDVAWTRVRAGHREKDSTSRVFDSEGRSDLQGMERHRMDTAKYTIAAETIAAIKRQIFDDTWRGTFRHESFTEKFVERAGSAHCFVDAGAEFGFYTWLALKHMPEPRRIVLFEPEPERHLALQHALGDYKEVTVMPQALGRSAGTIRLYKESVHHSCTLDASLSQSNEAVPVESFEVDVIALDSYFAQAPQSVDLIKMDIEGAELFALQGMERILSMGQPEIFLEFHGAYLEACQPGGWRVLRDLLQHHGYAIYACDGLACVPAGLEKGRLYLKPSVAAGATAV